MAVKDCHEVFWLEFPFHNLVRLEMTLPTFILEIV
jgi:hypothetical protein